MTPAQRITANNLFFAYIVTSMLYVYNPDADHRGKALWKAIQDEQMRTYLLRSSM